MPIKCFCAHDGMVPIDQLKPHPDNPNRHPRRQIELLKKLIQKFGWRAPITVSSRSGLIIRGHGRLEAARELGLDECPVDYQDYESEAEERADLVADNTIPELSVMDDETLLELLKEIEATGFDVELTGFDHREIEKITDKVDAKLNRTRPEVEFSQELLLEHNYIVLYFDNPLDWNVAVEKFGLKKVKDLIERKAQPVGIGRVIRGADWLERIH